MNFQWYPGHMTKARRQMEEDIKLIDLVIEVLDARAPLASRNPDIDTLARGKARLILLNKADLADDSRTAFWTDYFQKSGANVCTINSRNNADMKQIAAIVNKACAEKLERDKRRGIRMRPVRAMVVGIPNVGKSTFINTYAKRSAAKTGNKPGVTKGTQWIRMGSNLELLDTPGILWPKFEDQSVGLRLAILGSIRDEIMNISELAAELIKVLEKMYPGKLEDYYGLADREDSGEDCAAASVPASSQESAVEISAQEAFAILEGIARAKGCLKSGGVLDIDKAAGLLLENFRNGRIGKITLE